VARVIPWPDGLFDPAARVMVVMAHPDDEMSCGGLAQRLPPTALFAWATDGDGLAAMAGVRRPEFAEARRLESEAAMAAVGVPRERLRFLANSEVSIYESFDRCQKQPGSRHVVFDHVRTLARQMAAEVLSFRPDAVVTMGWQGANPVHDLVHVLVRRALDRLPGTRMFEVPIFDPLSLVPLRFPSWYKGAVHEVRLSDAERAAKARMMACWPSQDMVLKQVKTIVRVTGNVSRLWGRGYTMDDLLAVEHFAPVPRDRDYTKSPHGMDRLDYLMDSHIDGSRLSFEGTVAPIARALAAGT
jgi:LmbE family N-acetylglucosaminyl deacetylase